MKLSPQVKRSIQNIALCVGSLILTLLVLEIGTRAYLSWKIGSMRALEAHKFDPRRKNLILADILQSHPNKRIVYELVPNREGQLVGTPLKINSPGLQPNCVALWLRPSDESAYFGVRSCLSGNPWEISWHEFNIYINCDYCPDATEAISWGAIKDLYNH